MKNIKILALLLLLAGTVQAFSQQASSGSPGTPAGTGDDKDKIGTSPNPASSGQSGALTTQAIPSGHPIKETDSGMTLDDSKNPNKPVDPAIEMRADQSTSPALQQDISGNTINSPNKKEPEKD